MKKRILSMLLVIVMVLALVPVQALADGEQIEITGKANVAKDGTTSFFAKVSGAALNDVEWEAKDNTIANVEKVENTNECKITGLTEGRTTIVAKKDGCTQGERNITVYIPQGAVTITGPDTVKAGEPVELSFAIPEGVTQKVASWSLTKESKALATLTKVNANTQKLTVNADATGSVTVNLTFNGAQTSKTLTIATPDPPAPGKITVDAADNTVLVDKTLELTTKIGGYAVTGVTCVADSSSTGEVEVTGNGNPFTVMGKKSGNVRLNLSMTTDKGSYEGYFDLTVKSKQLVITGGNDSGETTVFVGDTLQLGVTDGDGNAVDGVSWECVNTDGSATVGDSGLLEGKAAGSSNVIVSKTGYSQGTLTVTVVAKKAVKKITANQPSVKVNVAGSNMPSLEELVTVLPADAYDKTLIGTSSDSTVAEIVEGKVVAHKAGRATITVASVSNTKKTASFELIVEPAAQIVLDPNLPTAILAGDKVVLKAELVNAATGEKLDAKISWKLAKETDAYYASVTNGTLNTKSDLLDRFPIDVVATVDSAKFDAEPVTYTVNVIPRASAITLTVDGKKVNDKETVLNLEEKDSSVTIESSVSPSKAEQGVTWELTGGAGIYKKTIESDGSLTLTPSDSNRTGVITVKAVADDGTDVSATTTVRFEKQGTGIQFSESDIQLRGGASVNLGTYLDLGENGNSSTVTWTFADGKTVYKAGGKRIATLSKTGKLTTKPVTKFTELTVIATNTVSGNPAKLTVNLYPATKSIKITSDDLPGKTIAFDKDNLDLKLRATVKPNAAADANWSLKWSSSDENVIKTVDAENGIFRIKNAGKVRITCETTDGSKVKGCLYLEITKDSADVKISAPAKTLTSGESMNLKAKVLTANDVKAANQSVIWSIADEYGNETKAATIFPTGRVTAGDVDQSTKVVITATSVQDSSVSSTLELTILPNTRKTLHVKADDELVNGTYAMSLNDSCVLDGVWLKSNKNATETMADGCTFFSSNTKVATVDEELGVLTAVGYGTSTITVRCYDPIYDSKADNLYTTTITVKVLKKVGTVTIDAPALKDLRSGKSVSLSAAAWTDYANGTKADNQGFTWEVTENGKETDVATINSNGVLTANTVAEKHTVVVKAISKESGISDTATFNIFPAENVKFYFALNGEEYTGTLPVDLDTGLGGLSTLR